MSMLLSLYGSFPPKNLHDRDGVFFMASVLTGEDANKETDALDSSFCHLFWADLITS